MCKGGTPENLKPFKPGVSGNPKGKKAGSHNLTTILKMALDLQVDTGGIHPITNQKISKKLSARELIILKQISAALGGNLYAIRDIWDRLEGKPKEFIEQTNINDSIPDWMLSMLPKPIDTPEAINRDEIDEEL